MATKAIEVYRDSIFSDAALLDGRRVHRELRGIGDVVYLSKHKLYAVTTHDAVTALLQNEAVFSSDRGVGVNPILNRLPDNKNTLLMSDGADHKRRRGVFIEPLTPESLRELKDTISHEADQLVGRLVEQGDFDVVEDFASYLPVDVVSKLVGLPEDVRANMVKWAPATFDSLGPLNRRVLRSLPLMGVEFLRSVRNLSEDTVVPGSWADRVFTAISDEALTVDEGKALITAYIIPSLDTTIATVAHMFWLLAKNPDSFTEIQADRSLIPGAVNEIVRLASPVIGFTRYAKQESQLCGYTIPKGKRLLALLPSANWDESAYSNPDTFDIRRDPRDHVAFGHGRHRCAGIHLAKLELEELLRALCDQARRLAVGEPEYVINGTLQGFRQLPGSIS